MSAQLRPIAGIREAGSAGSFGIVLVADTDNDGVLSKPEGMENADHIVEGIARLRSEPDVAVARLREEAFALKAIEQGRQVVHAAEGWKRDRGRNESRREGHGVAGEKSLEAEEHVIVAVLTTDLVGHRADGAAIDA